MFSNMLDCFFPSPALACSVKDGESGKEKQWFVATRNSRACSVFVFFIISVCAESAQLRVQRCHDERYHRHVPTLGTRTLSQVWACVKYVP